MAEAVYCSMADVANRLSQDGVDLRLDDSPPDADADILDNAASLIEEYCRPRYTPDQLASSRWIKQRATDLAAYLLCERRGNPVPASIERAWNTYLGMDGRPGRLELVRKGSLLIPDVAVRKVAVPVVSNVRVRLDPVGPRTVVEPSRSTGKAEDYRRNTDTLEFPDYNI